MDFVHLFPEKSDLLFREWNTCTEIIFKEAFEKATKNHEKTSFLSDFEISAGMEIYQYKYFRNIL